MRRARAPPRAAVRAAALRCGAAHAQEAAESGTPRPPTGALLTRLPWFSRSPWSFDFVCFLFKEELYIFIRAEVAF